MSLDHSEIAQQGLQIYMTLEIIKSVISKPLTNNNIHGLIQYVTAFVLNMSVKIIKEIKNAPECIVELYKHAGIFKNTRKVHKEGRGAAECFSHFSSVLKNSQVLI